MKTITLEAGPSISTLTSAGEEAKFKQLSIQWKKDTGHLSNLKKKCAHPCYQEIIRMGESALPFILEDLERTRDDWFVALKSITGADPVAPEFAGNVPKMTEVWLKWARERGMVA